MSDQQPQPMSALGVALVGLGVLLLLPGLCALVFAAQMVATEDVVRPATRDPYFQIVLFVWAICFAVALIGALLIRYAVRRHRRQGTAS